MKYVSYSFYKKIFIVTALFILIGSFNFASAAVKFGDVGEEVREVQVCLIAQELLNGEADGICGKATVQAIKDFQVAVGLPVDGICGSETFRLLRAAAYGEIDITDFIINGNVSHEIKPSGVIENYAEVGDIIKQGSTGPGVVSMQKKLIALDFLHGEADGICGEVTNQAIKDFQVAVGLPVDGICGMDTYAALENAPYDDTSDSYVLKESIENLPRVQKTIKVDATAYSIQESGVGYHTAMGTPVRHGVIAVDPIFIPLGTHVFIPGYGEAIAEDTGGDIVGYRIDIAFDSYYEALEFGRQILEIYVLEE